MQRMCTYIYKETTQLYCMFEEYIYMQEYHTPSSTSFNYNSTTMHMMHGRFGKAW